MSVVRTYYMANRKEVVKTLMQYPLKTGDVIYRQSYTSMYGIPFSTLVASLTKSKYSHAAVIFMKENVPYVFEMNDRGTIEYRLLDWLDFCEGGQFEIHRYKNFTADFEQKLGNLIKKYLDEDASYDFTYLPGNATLYCTESVCQLYKEAGVEICEPALIKDTLNSLWRYWVFKFLNGLMLKLSGKGFDMSVPVYFVGNTEAGMLASKEMVCLTPTNPLHMRHS